MTNRSWLVRVILLTCVVCVGCGNDNSRGAKRFDENHSARVDIAEIAKSASSQLAHTVPNAEVETSIREAVHSHPNFMRETLVDGSVRTPIATLDYHERQAEIEARVNDIVENDEAFLKELPFLSVENKPSVKRVFARRSVIHSLIGFECFRLGGEMDPWCIFPTNDSGKQCNDSLACEGICLAPESDWSSSELPDSGVCSDKTDYYGCVSKLEDGEIISYCLD